VGRSVSRRYNSSDGYDVPFSDFCKLPLR